MEQDAQDSAWVEITPEMIEAGAEVIVEWFDTGAVDDYGMRIREARLLAQKVLQNALPTCTAQV